MIAKKVLGLPDVHLVSKLDRSALMLKKHLQNGAILAYPAPALIVFDEGKSETIAKLLAIFERIKEAGAQRNQCVLLLSPEERNATFCTILLWNNWGGVTLPIIHSIDHTLEMIEEEMLNGNIPISDACIEAGHDFNVKD